MVIRFMNLFFQKKGVRQKNYLKTFFIFLRKQKIINLNFIHYRGYYRCSSSKGCPARKQVERSRVDPTVLIVTYACDHNHPLPPTKHHHSTAPAAITATASIATPSPKFPPEEFAVFASQPDLELGGDSLLADGHFSWFSEVSPTSLAMLESPVFVGGYSAEDDVAVFAMGEEEESLFADLGELPECSLVFR